MFSESRNVLCKHCIYTRFGCEVPGMIILHILKGAMQLDHSKDTSVHVSTCTSYNLSAFNASCVEDMALIICVFLHLGMLMCVPLFIVH